MELKKEYELEYLLFPSVSDKEPRSSQALFLKLEDYHELDKLGQDLENITGFSGMGLFKIDRQIVTAMLGAFLTYLIILMQWPSVDEDALPDYVNNICCAAYKDSSTNYDLIETDAIAKMVRKYI